MIIDLNDFGIRHAFDPWSNAVGGKVLWTFRGRFRRFPFDGLNQRRADYSLSPDVTRTKIEDKSSTVLRSCFPENVQSEYWDEILLEEAREIARYTNRLSVTPELAASCCRHVLSLDSIYQDTEYFNWAIIGLVMGLYKIEGPKTVIRGG
jgi:hypothetical protein